MIYECFSAHTSIAYAAGIVKPFCACFSKRSRNADYPHDSRAGGKWLKPALSAILTKKSEKFLQKPLTSGGVCYMLSKHCGFRRSHAMMLEIAG